MTEEQLKQYHAMFSDLWRFYKANCNVREDDAFWNKVTKDADLLYKKYNTELCKNMVLNILDELEKRYRELKKPLPVREYL